MLRIFGLTIVKNQEIVKLVARAEEDAYTEGFWDGALQQEMGHLPSRKALESAQAADVRYSELVRANTKPLSKLAPKSKKVK